MEKNPNPPFPAIENLMQRADEFARREPAKAIASGLGAGFLIHLLPLRAISSLVVGIAITCARPVLLFLGLMKAGELCRTNQQNTDRHE